MHVCFSMTQNDFLGSFFEKDSFTIDKSHNKYDLLQRDI